MRGDCIRKDGTTYLIGGHTVLDEQTDARVEETDIALEHEVALRLSGDPGLEFAQAFLGLITAAHKAHR